MTPALADTTCAWGTYPTACAPATTTVMDYRGRVEPVCPTHLDQLENDDHVNGVFTCDQCGQRAVEEACIWPDDANLSSFGPLPDRVNVMCQACWTAEVARRLDTVFYTTDHGWVLHAVCRQLSHAAETDTDVTFDDLNALVTGLTDGPVLDTFLALLPDWHGSIGDLAAAARALAS
jgi:hypothetical protein